MKNKFTSFLVATLVLTFIGIKSFAQVLPCPINIDWELGDTTGWLAFAGGPTSPPAASLPGGVVTGPNPPLPGTVLQTSITTPVPGFVTGRHTITNTAMAADPYGGFAVVPPGGGQNAFKLGDDNSNNGGEKVSFTFTVPATDDYAIKIMYAVVIENPPGHDPQEMPRLTISVKDVNGNTVKDGCYDRNFIAGGDLPGFIDVGGVQYKDWTELTLNLKGTANQTLTLEITTGDCSLGGHFGYGYFDVFECSTIEKIVMDSCNLDRKGAYLTAPPGYMTYEWYNSDYSQFIDTGRFVAFQPLTTTPDFYNVVCIPYPSVSFCNDTFETDLLANINIDKLDFTCTEPNAGISLNVNAIGGQGALSYAWTEYNGGNTLSCTSCATPTATTPVSDFYKVLVSDDAGCKKSEIASVGVNENALDAKDDFVFCHPGYTSLDVTPSGPLPIEPVTCGTGTACPTPTLLEVRTEFRDAINGKSDTSTVLNPFAAQYSSGHMQFILKWEDLYKARLRYGTLTSLGFEIVDPGAVNFDNFTISLACTKLSALSDFVTNTTVVYTGVPPTTLPTAGWNDFTFDQPFNWDTAQNIIVDICFSNAVTSTPATVIALNTGSTDAIMDYTNAIGANVCATDPAEVRKYYTGRPSMRFGYCKSPDRPFDYLWTPGTFLSDSTAKDPIAYITETTKYYITSIGGSDCPLIDSVTVTVPIHDYVVYPLDTTVCLDEPFLMTASGTFSSVEWFDYDPLTNVFSTPPSELSCNNCPNPIALPRDSMMYAVVYTDKDACTDTFYVNVNVKPLPPVKIVNNDTVIKYGTDIMLLVQGAYLYTWTPSSSLSNPNIVNPMASPLDPTLYVVYGIGENGCRKLDSVMVDIDYSTNLFVPTAFSPNGDGKNDVFRVSNITFQRLQEFKVFNRWGQEIFSTTDIRSGWDGSWRGQPQDMGVYQYIIKVSSPDGIIKTYKGDVTLVR